MDTKTKRNPADRPFISRAEMQQEQALMAKYGAVRIDDINAAAPARQQQSDAPAVRQSD